MRALIPAVLLLFTGACAADLLDKQVGKPLSQAVENMGTPYQAFDTGSGHRGFVWLRGDFGMISGYGNTNLYGGATTTEDFTTAAFDEGGRTRCKYVLYAKANVERPSVPEHWTVTDARPIDDPFCL